MELMHPMSNMNLCLSRPNPRQNERNSASVANRVALLTS